MIVSFKLYEQGHRRYLESFMLISLLEVCQQWGVKKGVI